MNTTFRRIVVSGSAAVALLGGAAAITTATAPPASAAETRAVVENAVTAPVTLPDGRTIRITGMGGYGHRATEAHIATVAAYTPGTDLPNSGTGSQLQTPYNTGQVPANYQQVQMQTGGGTIAVGVVAILLLGVIAWFRIKGPVKVGDAVLFLFLGVALSGTVIGVMAKTMTENGVGSLGGVLGGL
ncbi:hypothetical protein ABZT06_08475 [Streptomyces sp. NPDC005483]|uniref:hypothetical protein n=1 Tax=Streptomyces sp. NPDC005483 TaxID=3154882 RepID=UPI0033B7D2C8